MTPLFVFIVDDAARLRIASDGLMKKETEIHKQTASKGGSYYTVLLGVLSSSGCDVAVVAYASTVLSLEDVSETGRMQ